MGLGPAQHHRRRLGLVSAGTAGTRARRAAVAIATPALRSLCIDATLRRYSMDAETTPVAPDTMEDEPIAPAANGGSINTKKRTCDKPSDSPAASTQDTFAHKRGRASEVHAVAPGLSPL